MKKQCTYYSYTVAQKNNRNRRATNSLSNSGLACLIITFALLQTTSTIPHSEKCLTSNTKVTDLTEFEGQHT